MRRKRVWNLNTEEIANSYDSEFTFDKVPIRKLLIANIPENTTHKELKKKFVLYGKVEDCILKKRKKNAKMYAFVTYSSIEDSKKARLAGESRQISIYGQYLRVLPANSWNQPDSIRNLREIDESPKKLCDNDELETMFDNKCTIDDENAAIHKLNDDCLFYIFKHLTIYERITIERVCKRWRAVSMELWRSFKILDFSNSKFSKLKSPFLYHILRRSGEYITNIDFSAIDYYEFGNSTMSMIAKLCPNVESINYGNSAVYPQTIKALAKNCTNIKILRTRRLRQHQFLTLRDSLSSVLIKNKSLQCLDIDCSSFVKSLIKCLYSLPYQSMNEITLRDVSLDNFLDKIIQKIPSLSILKLSFVYQYPSREQCILPFKSSIEKHAKSLAVLEISGLKCCINVIPIAELKNLKELNVSRSDFVDNKFLKALSSSCKLLTNLNISEDNYVTNSGLSNVVSLPKLLHLDVSRLDNITDEVLGDMSILKTLNCADCMNVGNAGLINLIAIGSDLEFLDITGCKLVSDKLIEDAAELTKHRINGKILVMKLFHTNINVNRALDFAMTSPFLSIDIRSDYLFL